MGHAYYIRQSLRKKSESLVKQNVMAWSGKEMRVAEVQRFAVKQIKEKTRTVSENQESGLFYSSRQNLSTLSSSSLSSKLTQPYLYSVTRAARNTSIARSQNASLGNKIGEMCISLPALNTVFSTITTPNKAWVVSNKTLKTCLLNHIM